MDIHSLSCRSTQQPANSKTQSQLSEAKNVFSIIEKRESEKILCSKNTSRRNSYLRGNRHVEKITEDSSLPNDLSKLIANAFSEEKILEVTQLNLYDLTPTRKCLEEVSVHYKTKYGIDVECWSVNDFKERMIDFQVSSDQTFKGLILFKYDRYGGEFSHVTPVLMRKNSITKSIEVLNLDVLGYESNSSPNVEARAAMLEVENTTPIFVSGERQASKFGCRAGALLLLRNALTDLHLREDTTSLAERTKAVLLDGTLVSAELPIAWTYCEQILLNEKVPDEEVLRKPGSSALSLRQGYRAGIERRIRVGFQIFNNHISCDTIKIWNQHLEYSVSIGEEWTDHGKKPFLWIESEEVVERNVALLLKTYKYVGLIGRKKVSTTP